jgi:hypothetical protein
MKQGHHFRDAGIPGGGFRKPPRLKLLHLAAYKLNKQYPTTHPQRLMPPI